MKTRPHWTPPQSATAEQLIAYLDTAVRALEKIADCSESDLASYCREVDGFAVDALVSLECDT